MLADKIPINDAGRSVGRWSRTQGRKNSAVRKLVGKKWVVSPARLIDWNYCYFRMIKPKGYRVCLYKYVQAKKI